MTHSIKLLPGATFEHRFRAVNTAAESENKIHENSVAKQYGFRGGLVPGVTDYAYMTRPALDAFGPEWLERGTMSARFNAPIYDGDTVTCRATVVDGRTLELAALTPDGQVCAPGKACLPEEPATPPTLADFPAPAPPAREARPDADERSLAVGTVLGSVEADYNAEAAATFAVGVPDDHPAYAGGAIAHPGFAIRFANSALDWNVRLGPWIHVSSDTQHFGVVRLGDHLSTRARVVELFERKGHHFVTLDVATFANGGRPIQRVTHTSIYRLRPPA